MTDIRVQQFVQETLRSSPDGGLRVQGFVRETMRSSPDGGLRVQQFVRETLRSSVAAPSGDEGYLSIIW